MSGENVQISKDLFREIYNYLWDIELGREVTVLDAVYLREKMYEKIQAMERRKLYTQSKTAETPEERERARKEYAEKACIPKNGQW